MFLPQIPAWIADFPAVEKVYLDDNDIRVFPAWLGEIETMKVVAAERNRISIVDSIGGIEQLFLDGNETLGTILPWTNLIQLDVSNCDCDIGHLPEDIFSHGLEEFYV